MITTQQHILKLLDDSSVAYELYEHPPVFTVEEAKNYCSDIPGAHVKNLFIRNKKKTAYWLITVEEDKQIDLSAMENLLNMGRISFVSAEELIMMLGVQPGSVTPIAIINDRINKVKLIFDSDLFDKEKISIHPLKNTATISLKLNVLISFIEAHHEKIEFIKLPIKIE